MTKEQFLSGVSFRVKGLMYKGACTFSYSKEPGCICKQSRSSIDEKVVINDYECNVLKIGRLGFTAFTFILNKKVVIKHKFEDLVIFEDQGPEYDGAGFTIEDREEDPEELTHHCDEPSCNCSI